MIAHWPVVHPEEGWEAQKLADFSLVMDLVRAIRNLRAEKKVTPGKRLEATIVAGARFDVLMAQLKTIAALAFLDPYALRLEETLAGDSPIRTSQQNQAILVVSGIEVYLPLAGLVNAEAERSRLEKELAENQSQVSRLEALLSSPFAQKAPPAVVDKERQKLAAYQETVAKLESQLNGLGG